MILLVGYLKNHLKGLLKDFYLKTFTLPISSPIRTYSQAHTVGSWGSSNHYTDRSQSVVMSSWKRGRGQSVHSGPEVQTVILSTKIKINRLMTNKIVGKVTLNKVIRV